MRILVWHGYLLAGTGSNIYTRALAREWTRAGHEVVVVCQERHPERHDLAGAQVVRPELPDGLLPVFVVDRYEGLRPKLLQEWTRGERARYVVKAHGSELEYAMRGNADLAAWGRESLAGAEAVFVGSGHIRDVLEEVVGHVDRVHEVPPGVDVEEFRPEPRAEALPRLVAQARADTPNPGNAQERLPDEGNAERLAEFLAADGPTVVYFGKLLYNKGVHVLLEALRE